MSQWYKVNTASLNIRSGPGPTNADIGDLLNGDQIESMQSSNGWLKFTRWLRAGKDMPLPGAECWCSGAYCVAIAPPVLTPPVKVPFKLTVEGFKPYTGELEKA